MRLVLFENPQLGFMLQMKLQGWGGSGFLLLQSAASWPKLEFLQLLLFGLFVLEVCDRLPALRDLPLKRVVFFWLQVRYGSSTSHGSFGAGAGVEGSTPRCLRHASLPTPLDPAANDIGMSNDEEATIEAQLFGGLSDTAKLASVVMVSEEEICLHR